MHTIIPEDYPPRHKKNPYKLAFFIITGAWMALSISYMTEHIQAKKLVRDNEKLVSQGNLLLNVIQKQKDRDTLIIRILINPKQKSWIDTTFHISLNDNPKRNTEVFYGNFEGTVFHFLN